MADAMPAAVPLVLYRGDTRTWEDQLTTVDGTTESPLDLTGYSFLSQIRATADAADPMAALDVTVVDAAAGTLRRVLTAEAAATLIPGRAVWDFQITSPDGTTRTLMAGPVTIKADISRPVTP